jgi:tRNA A37 threonylcarbamoyladenosine dehydratase
VSAVAPQFERTELLIGASGLARLAGKHVFVAGLGGVGASCAEALARAGVGALTLADHDVIKVSNINRQLPALLSTVGRSKVEAMRERILDIDPACRVGLVSEFLQEQNLAVLIPAGVDYVVDCIDALNCKVNLIVHALERGIPVASSMGAGNRLDPSRVRIADIGRTEVCALARRIRQRLRRRGFDGGVLAVYSDEPARPCGPMQDPEGPGRGRCANGTISYMPPLFGIMLAGAVILDLLGEGGSAARRRP